MSNPELFYYYSWDKVPDHMLGNIFAEFKANGVDNLVFNYAWFNRIFKEPDFFFTLSFLSHKYGIRLGECHAPYGDAFDLNCASMGRRAGMIEDQKTAMRYATELGSKTFTIHVGTHHWMHEHMPLEETRKWAHDALEQLLPEAEKLGIVIAVENSFEATNSATEVVNLVKDFDSPFIGCCFDCGHANMMRPFPGKDNERFAKYRAAAWWQGIVEEPDTLGKMMPYVVTCHLHDNDGYIDFHALPGTGTVDWKELMPRIRQCPRLISMQTEVRTIGYDLSVRELTEKFNEILKY